MANIIINGLKSKTGGGKSILDNYLSLLKASHSEHRFFVLTPDRAAYEDFACDFVEIIDIHRLWKKNLLFPILYEFIMPQVLRIHDIDLIFNLGDIVIPTDRPQLYLFDWSYAAYPESTVWKTMDLKSYLVRKTKLSTFRRYLPYATTVIAQSEALQERLRSLYGLKDIVVVPNAVSIENLDGGEPFDFEFPEDKTNLVYLAYYYPHKNFEVFIPLAQEISKRGLPFTIITTVDASQHPRAKVFLDNIKRLGLDDVIRNIGPVEMKHVPSFYQQSDGMLMPTLLESFSGTYVEAMYHEVPIFTSHFDFATAVCKDAAFYFDPLDAESILSTITKAYESRELLKRKTERGRERLGELLTWEQAFEKYQELLETLLKEAVDHRS